MDAGAPYPEQALEPTLKRRVQLFVRENRFLLVFAALSSTMGVSVGMALVATSLYAVQLGSSERMLGLIAGSQSVGVVVMSLPLGFVIDRAGPTRMFVTGTLVAGLIYALLPVYPAPAYLLACTLLISFFMPMRFVSLNTVFLQQLVQLGEAKAGWYRGTHMIGMFLVGPLIGAQLVETIGAAWTFRVIAAAFLVTVCVSPIVFSRYAKPAERRREQQSLRTQLIELVRDRKLLGLCSIECFTQSVSAYFNFFIVVIALDQLKLSPAQASSFISIKGVTFTIALFTLGALVSRLGARGSYAASFLVLAGSLAALGCADDVRATQLASLTLGLGLGTLQITTLTQFARVGARTGHGKASALNALFGPTGGIFSSLLGASLGKAFGLQAVFLVLGGVSSLACAAFFLRRVHNEGLAANTPAE